MIYPFSLFSFAYYEMCRIKTIKVFFNVQNAFCTYLQTMFCSVAMQERFTQDMQPHYIYSPREMTRWVRGICEAIRPMETLDLAGLVRIWAHEALRLFQDR